MKLLKLLFRAARPAYACALASIQFFMCSLSKLVVQAGGLALLVPCLFLSVTIATQLHTEQA